jgi:hypothetical protein
LDLIALQVQMFNLVENDSLEEVSELGRIHRFVCARLNLKKIFFFENRIELM